MCAFQASLPMASRDNYYTVPGQHVVEGIAFPGVFTAAAINAVKDFEFRDDDVIIASYPKTGELLSSLMDNTIAPYKLSNIKSC